MTTVTQWFDARITPSHIGVYEKKWDGFLVPVYQMWDGFQWLNASYTVNGAANSQYTGIFKNDPWRGLAVKP